jgi:DNA-binding MarR family transcriptional regulator
MDGARTLNDGAGTSNQSRSNETVELAARLRLVVTRLARRLRQQADTGVSPSMLSALSTVERHGSLTLGELAAHEGVAPPTMTAIVARLEEASLVRREPDAADRRVTRVGVASAGQRLLDRTRSAKTAYLARRLGRMSPHERAILEEAVPILERLMSEEREARR